MKIVVTGSRGNVSRPLVAKLVEKGHDVKVVSSTPARANDIEAMGATALIGSLTDESFIVESFKGADAVYTMVPPDFSVADYTAFSDQVHQNYVKAVEKNNVQYVVNLSSIGSALAGVAPLSAYYNLETRLNTVKGLNIVHLRPGMFYTNFYGSMELMKYQGITGHNVGGSVDLIMTHPKDIADAAFSFLDTLSFRGNIIQYVVSDVKTGNDVASIFGDVIGKPLNWVEFPDEQLLAALMQNGFSKDAAQTYVVAMGEAIRMGLLNEHYKNVKEDVYGDFGFDKFANEFAYVYKMK